MVVIRNIIIKNFRQHRNVELKFYNKNGTYYFVGKNGIGKSNLMNAICWCLYGTTPFRSDSDKSKDDVNIVNIDAIKNKEDEVLVRLDMVIDGVLYTIRRKSTDYKLRSTILSKRSDFSIAMSMNASNWTPVQYPENFIERLLPQGLSNLFIFDGEVIRKLFDDSYHESLKSQVEAISDINVINAVIEDLDKVERKYSKQRDIESDKQNEYRLAQEELERNESKWGDLKKKSESKNRELVGFRREREEIYEQMKGDSENKRIIDEIERLEHNESTMEARVQEAKKRYQKSVVENYAFAICAEQIKKYIQDIKEGVKQKKMPPAISGDLIASLLTDGVCICGHHIDGEGKRYLQEMLNDSREKEELQFICDHQTILNNKLNNIAKSLSTIKDNERMLNDAYLERNNANEKLVKLRRQAADIDAEAINKRDNRLRVLDELITEASSLVYEYEMELKRLKSNIDELNSAIEQYEAKTNRNNSINKKIQYTKQTKIRLEEIKIFILNETRNNIEDCTSDIYKKLHWNNDVKKVSFSQDYKIKVTYKDGHADELKDLSNGEKKMLGIAVMNALSTRLENFDFPLFIDSPTEDLDTSVIPEVLDNLSALSESKQIFITTLNRPEVIKHLAVVPKERKYRMEQQDGVQHTTMIKEWES